MIDVSAFIPYFNAHETVKAAIDSLRSSTVPPKEIIVVDDGSEKNSRYLLEQIIDGYSSPSIRLISHRMNRGGGSARNTACEAATFNWLFCLDADNLVSSSLIESLSNSAQESTQSNVAITPQHLVYFNSETGRVSHSWDFGVGPITRSMILNSPSNPNSSGNYLFDRKSFEEAGGYPTRLGSLDAFGFGFRQVLSGTLMRVAPGSHYFHRLSADSYWMRESRDASLARAMRAKSLLLESAGILTPSEIAKLFRSRNQAKWFLKLGAGRQRKFGAKVVSGPELESSTLTKWQSGLSELLGGE
jgi:glycosyltransferase involved in cell wall biosynthesis